MAKSIGKQSESTALYVYWDSHEQFKEKLYPIAEAAHQQFGVKAVVVTSNWRTFPPELLENDWLKLHHFDEAIEHGLNNKKELLNQIGGYFLRHLDDKRFWRCQARNLMEKYSPTAIFIWKPYFQEVPWLIKLARQRGINSLFIGEYNITFGYKHIREMHRRNKIISAMNSATGHLLYKKLLIFGGVYFDSWVESLIYKCMGIWDWKKTPITVPAATYHLVSNEMYREELLRLGAKGTKIIATGVAEQDELFKLRQKYLCIEEVQKERNLLKIGEKDRLIVFALENFPALRTELPEVEVNDMIRRVISECLTFATVKVIIKIHPRDSIDNYVWVNDEYPDVQLLQRYETTKLAAIADVFLVHGTTSVSMPLAINRPALIINFKNHWICEAVHQAYGVPQVRSSNDLSIKLKEIFDGDFKYNSRESKIAMSGIDGKAVQRILLFSGLSGPSPVTED